jgi:hypothetical protein
MDDSILGEDIALGDSFKLAFVKHVPGFIALKRPLRRGQRPKPQPRTHTVLHKLMVMFHYILQIFTLSK